ncbi:MAG: YtxH domain-containing protein [Gemmatimonadales bacterium]
MNESEHGSAKTFTAGLLIGALVGAGVALLFAPQSGEETRRLIRRKAKHLTDDAKDRYEDVRHRVRAARRHAEEALSD